MGGKSSGNGFSFASSASRDFVGTGSMTKPVAFLAHDGVLTRKLELTGNSDGFVASVLEDFDVAFGACFGGLRWHMSSKCPGASFVQLPRGTGLTSVYREIG